MIRRLTFAFVVLALACDSTEPEAALPDLTGLYRLVSLSQGGLTETPPRISAVLGLLQHDVENGWAVGGARLSVRRETPGGHSSGGSQGEYAHDAEGRMVMVMSPGYTGIYTVNGDTLITTLTSEYDRHAIRGEAVWVLDDSL